MSGPSDHWLDQFVAEPDQFVTEQPTQGEEQLVDNIEEQDFDEFQEYHEQQTYRDQQDFDAEQDYHEQHVHARQDSFNEEQSLQAQHDYQDQQKFEAQQFLYNQQLDVGNHTYRWSQAHCNVQAGPDRPYTMEYLYGPGDHYTYPDPNLPDPYSGNPYGHLALCDSYYVSPYPLVPADYAYRRDEGTSLEPRTRGMRLRLLVMSILLVLTWGRNQEKLQGLGLMMKRTGTSSVMILIFHAAALQQTTTLRPLVRSA